MYLFIIPLAVMIVTQGIKLSLEYYQGNFSWSHVNSYGGMPSSHAAFVASLSYILGRFQGLDSPAFAVSLVLLIVVLRDAMGFRWQLGIHGKILNKLIKELPATKEYQFPVLSERLGHTPLEVSVGLLTGILLSMLAAAFL
jgi:acid phosphatase family membrane protein YuiD